MKKLLLTVLFTLCLSTVFAAKQVQTAEALAKRIVPTLANYITFKQIKSKTDTFAISTKDGKVLIEGNNANSMAVGLNNYLRRYLGTNVSWYVAQPIQVPEQIVLPNTPYGAKAAVETRFFLNYCTFGYTMPYWEWKEWERFIDWMALNGVTMPLAMTGAEKSWYETWRSFGLADEEIRETFTGPAHLAWHWMSCIDNFQGPLSHEWMDRQEALQKRILARERELGMTPVLPAFAGHVPNAVSKHYPDAKITKMSQWAGFPVDNHCYFLDPSDPLYPKVQKRFLETQNKLYGTDHIYGIDPFNEVDSPDWSEEFLKKASKGIYASLSSADPKAKWLMMTWNFYFDRKNWTKPRIQAFLEGVDNDNLILLDYYCEHTEIWRRTDKYFGKPYVWCYLGNFGGNTTIQGNIQDISEKISNTLKDGGENVVGIGGTLEGFDVNPVLHEFVLAKAWKPNITPNEWFAVWSNSRGGKKSPKINEAWKLMADSVYNIYTSSVHSHMTNNRPVFGSIPTPKTAHMYKTSNLLKVLDLLLASNGVDDNAAYRFDVMNVTRQLLGNEFNCAHNLFTKAYNDKKVSEAKIYAAKMNDIILDLDALMSTDPNFSLSQWIADARRHGSTMEEADSYDKNVRTLLTIWGYPDNELNDYSNRQWSGLLRNYYGKRWQMFTDAAIEALEQGQNFDEESAKKKIIKWEGEWPKQLTPMTPVTDESPVDIARLLRKKYFGSNEK